MYVIIQSNEQSNHMNKLISVIMVNASICLDLLRLSHTVDKGTAGPYLGSGQGGTAHG